MNLIGFVKNYGHLSFRDYRFSDVDALILAELAYINFELLMAKGQTSLKFSDIPDEAFKNKDVFRGSVDARPNKKILYLLVKSNRYKDVVIKDIVNKYSKEEENQFYVATFELPTGNLYISYRGTDTSLTGWKEDFLLTVYDKIKAQVQAEKYLVKELGLNPGKRFYVGGHSKGGNLAFYAALNLPEIYNHQMIGAFSFDGPGFRQGIKDYKSYEMVKGRLMKFRTFNNVIGSVYEDVDNYRVVYSNGILGGHDSFGWHIVKKTGFFRFARDVSPRSKALNHKFMSWLDSLSLNEKMLTVEAFFRIFNNNETIYDLFKNLWRNLFAAKKSLSVYSEEDRLTLKHTFKSLFGFLFNEKKMRRVSKKEIKENESNGEGGEKND